MWIIVYVDDLIIATTSLNAQKLIKDFLSTTFKMKEIGIPSMFLGMNLIHDPERKLIMLNQQT